MSQTNESKMRFLKFLTVPLVFLSCMGNAAPKSSGFSFFKEGERQVRDRWTIASWWDTKQKVRTMDYWLARNRKQKGIDFSLQTAVGSYQIGTTASEKPKFPNWSLRTQAFASLFGIEAQYFSSKEQMTSMEAKLWIRVFGIQLQDSQLLLGGGFRKSEWKNSESLGPSVGTAGETLSSPFGSARLEIFLVQNLGVSGEFSISEERTSNQQKKLSETLWSTGVFLDFSSVRVIGFYRNSRLKEKGELSNLTAVRDGYSGALEFFF